MMKCRALHFGRIVQTAPLPAQKVDGDGNGHVRVTLHTVRLD